MTKKKKLAARLLEKEYGSLPSGMYRHITEAASGYFRHHMSGFQIDDITWNDLDMDNFYMLINNTCSSMGEEYLYSMLRKPYFDPETKEERERVMQYFDQNETVRYEIMYILSSISCLSFIIVVGVLGGSRTLNLQRRRLILYPVELRVRFIKLPYN